MLLIIGHLQENTPDGMQQLQYYNFGLQTLNPQMLSNAIEWVYTAFFCSNSAKHLRNISEEILFSHFATTLNNAFKWELASEDEGYKCGSESLSIPTPLCRAPCLYYVSTCEYLSFGTATSRTHSLQQPGNLTTVHHHLTFEEDDSSSLDSNTLHTKREHHSPVEHPMACYLTSTDKEEEEHFPTAPLDVILDGRTRSRQALMHLWTFTTWSVPLPCPWLDQLHPAPDYTPQYMGPQQHFLFPKCDNNCQWWGYS